jgi:hypothetical protein
MPTFPSSHEESEGGQQRAEAGGRRQQRWEGRGAGQATYGSRGAEERFGAVFDDQQGKGGGEAGAGARPSGSKRPHADV